MLAVGDIAVGHGGAGGEGEDFRQGGDIQKEGPRAAGGPYGGSLWRGHTQGLHQAKCGDGSVGLEGCFFPARLRVDQRFETGGG